VVAHQRREFLLDALRSIERQTLPRSQFEVFLLKDFETPELRPMLDLLGVTVVDLPPGPLGTWFVQVRERLRGDLVAFLDDDDLFEPGKLDQVLEDFRSDRTAVYLHHATRALIEPGRDAKPATDQRARTESKATRTVTPADWRMNFRGLWQRGPAFNLSSIVVRRQIVNAFPDQLGRIQVSLSAFLFYATLCLNGNFLLESRALTRYRREEGFGPGGNPTPRSARRLSALARPRGSDAGVLLELVGPLRFPSCESPLHAARAQADLVEALEGAGVGRKRALSDLLLAFRFRSLGALAAERSLLRDALKFVVAPQWGRQSWERHCAVQPP
jgi:hypothetical protein